MSSTNPLFRTRIDACLAWFLSRSFTIFRRIEDFPGPLLRELPCHAQGFILFHIREMIRLEDVFIPYCSDWRQTCLYREGRALEPNRCVYCLQADLRISSRKLPFLLCGNVRSL